MTQLPHVDAESVLHLVDTDSTGHWKEHERSSSKGVYLGYSKELLSTTWILNAVGDGGGVMYLSPGSGGGGW